MILLTDEERMAIRFGEFVGDAPEDDKILCKAQALKCFKLMAWALDESQGKRIISPENFVQHALDELEGDIE